MREGDEGSLEKGGGLVGAYLNEASKKLDTGDEETMSHEIIKRKLVDGCFESRNSFFAESCRQGVSDGGQT